MNLNLKNFLMLLTLSTMIIIVLIILSQIHLPHLVFYTQTSINKYHDDLNTVLSLVKPEIHVIGIGEHKRFIEMIPIIVQILI